MDVHQASAPTGNQTPDKDHYDKELDYFTDPTFLDRHAGLLRSYQKSFIITLKEFAVARGGVRILELGAGTCMTSVLLSREPWIKSMHCSDISSTRMDALANRMAAKFNGTTENMTFSEADFTYPLDFEDASFDVILFDSALHHTRNMWGTLRDCHRILSKDGLLIAQREQYLGLLTFKSALKRILASREVKDGVSENAYFREQYEYYFRATGFSPNFVPVSYGKLKYISFMNGLLHSKWTIIARKTDQIPNLQ